MALATHVDIDSLTVIDTETPKIVKVIEGFQTPTYVAVSSTEQKAYVVNRDAETIAVVDLTSFAVLDTWHTASYGPIVLSPGEQYLYVGSYEKVLALDTVDGRATAEINLLPGQRNIYDMEISPDGRWVIVAHTSTDLGDWSIVSVIDTTINQVVEMIPFKDHIQELALYPATCSCHYNFLPIAINSQN